MAGFRRPVGAVPLTLTTEFAVYTDIVEPPLSGTNKTLPSAVMPPGPGLEEVDTSGGMSAMSAPVELLYWFCEIWLDPESTTYTKFATGLTINEVGVIPEAKGEPGTAISDPFALGQAGET